MKNLEGKENVEEIREQLNKAIDMGYSKDEILEISQKLDIHIVNFLKKKLKGKG